MTRQQLFSTSHEAFVVLNNYVKHGWHGYVEQVGNMFRVTIAC